jgi:acyl-CoA dehydrogenase
MAKDLGTELEQLLVDELWRYRYEEIKPGPATERFHEFLDINRLRSPVFTTAGGTNEVLRMLVGRQLPGWASTRKGWALRSSLAATVFEQAAALDVDGGPRSVPRGQTDPQSAGLLGSLQAGGFLGVSVPEQLGGSGGGLNDALHVLRGAAYAGVSTPVIESPILAGWLLRHARLAFPWNDQLPVMAAGEIRLEEVGGHRVLTGTLERIAWPENATTLVVPVRQDGQLLVATVPRGALRLPPGHPPGAANTAGEPVARGFRLDRVPVTELAPASLAFGAAVEALSMRCALARAVGMAAALQRTAELTINYAGQRVQFGQPIARFQAVQTHLARLASEAQRVAVVVDAAQAALGDDEDPQLDPALIAAARTLAGDAAILGARLAHQVHGAIGVTMEYPLQRFTRRLWEWEAGDGTAVRWARRLGAAAVTGQLRAWQLITGTL